MQRLISHSSWKQFITTIKNKCCICFLKQCHQKQKKLQENQKQTYNQFQHANSKFEVELNTQADLSEWADMSGRNYNFIPNQTLLFISTDACLYSSYISKLMRQ